jgi:stearoyl-CoA desaturase (Delta-9 desaturase)
VLGFGVFGLLVFATQLLWIPFWAAGVINGVGHYFGYRNFETPDASRNIIPLGLFIGGEELHNNHHAYPSSAKLSNKWWELDLGWLYIRSLKLLGLAKIKKIAPKVRSEIGKHLIDIDTVRALARHRFHIITVYGRKVIRPVIQQECLRANRYYQTLLRRVRKVMTREDIQPDLKAQATLQQALDYSHALATVYHFKQQLKDLWQNSRQHQTQRLVRMQQWCVDAEQSGIAALEEFALYLRGYTEVSLVRI